MANRSEYLGKFREDEGDPGKDPSRWMRSLEDSVKKDPDYLLVSTTQLAKRALKQLRNSEPARVKEAIYTIENKPGRKIFANQLMSYLEHKVFIGEVLNEPLARKWTAETVEDFIGIPGTVPGAFKIDPTKELNVRQSVMESIVSLAILNDPDLEDKLMAENIPETTEEDLLENRRIVWQYPSPGTPLEPPYLVLVAVEHQDVAQAKDVVQSILGELVDYEGYKVPKTIKSKLGKL